MIYIVIYDLKARSFDFESCSSDQLITDNICLMQRNQMNVLCATADANQDERPHFAAGYKQRELGLLERLYQEYEATSGKTIKHW